MPPTGVEYGYRYPDDGTAVGPFRRKETAVRRVRENHARVLVQRPVGSTDPDAWKEVGHR